MTSDRESQWRFATRAIHVGQEPDSVTGATVPPIHPTSTFTQSSPGKHKGFEYARSSNPTRLNLERALASLEGGALCACFASGSAATTCVFATLSPGDKVLAYSDVYGGTFRLLKRVFEGFGLVPVFTDDPTPAGFSKLADNRTRLVWIESPTNPLLRCLDIAAIARIAHGVGAKFAVDNTFATPALQLPIPLGADYVVHSTTKYIGGHSDVIGGAVIVKDAALMERIAFLQNALGGVPGPFDCYLQHRGIKTLGIRMERHCANALALAKHLQGHAKLARVVYPFLEDHPDHALAKGQMCGGGGIVTIVFKSEPRPPALYAQRQGSESEVADLAPRDSIRAASGSERIASPLAKGGQRGVECDDPARAAAIRFCENVRVFSLAESLGGVESLVNHPAIMTHASIPREIREARGVTDGLVRLSVGIEAIEDLIADVDQALAKV